MIIKVGCHFTVAYAVSVLQGIFKELTLLTENEQQPTYKVILM